MSKLLPPLPPSSLAAIDIEPGEKRVLLNLNPVALNSLTKNKRILAVLELIEKEVSKLQSYKTVTILSLILVLNEEKRIPKKVWLFVRQLLLDNRLLQTLIISLNFSPHISPSVIKKIIPHLRMTKTDPVEKLDLASLLNRENMQSIQHLPESIEKAKETVANLLVAKEKVLIGAAVPEIDSSRSTKLPNISINIKNKNPANFKI